MKLVAVLVVCVLAAAGGYALMSDRAPKPSGPGVGAEGPEEREEPPRAAPVSGRDPVRTDGGSAPPRPDPDEGGADEPQPGPAPRPDDGEPPSPAVEEPPPNLTLAVRDAVQGGAIATFTVTATAGERRRWEGAEGLVELFLAPDQPHELRFEADDTVPLTHTITIPSSVPKWEESIYLEPSAPFSGIDVRAHDAAGAPVQHLNVTVWKLASRDAAPEGRPVWSRRGSSPVGRYRLPNVEPGDYYLEFRAVAEDGQPVPLQVSSERLHFGGSEQLPLTVTLDAGVLLALTVEDQYGAERGEEVTVRVIAPDGTVLPQVWIALAPEDRPAAVDRLAAPGRHVLRDALPPGQYRIEARVDGQRVGSTALDLWQPGTQDVRVIVQR